ncbi:dihydrofolate reductase family protein [Shewanella sp. JM162201]|uniref:Dihydrofolate reductase family protein n=1 Tax=Shewanella jiangmenensis TaxID=2837387 RepID=A0ABS5V5G2_9GAMM|nr:dihydrofolate reductase family protein [Shewanella jiangmenensis]MBT1445046.1 dihydrofolate reductase family protein [Shewanella jiangmenensis]
MANIVYIATSLDGFIADSNGSIDWLHSVPNPDGDDCGWAGFLSRIDAIVMGRTTFETVCSFDIDWPYPVPVFVLSNSLSEIRAKFADKAELVSSELAALVATLNHRGLQRLYIDGGKTVQGFMAADLIDELVITRLPIVLGGGSPLFGTLSEPQQYEHVNTEVLLGAMVKSHYRRVRGA